MAFTEDKDKFACWKFISETHRDLHEQRRKYEWKVFFTTITFYVLAVAASYNNKIVFSTFWMKFVVWIIFIISAFLVIFFLW